MGVYQVIYVVFDKPKATVVFGFFKSSGESSTSYSDTSNEPRVSLDGSHKRTIEAAGCQ